MEYSIEQDKVIKSVVTWALVKDEIRAVILTSIRAMDNPVLDLFSDYDIILLMKNILPYYENRQWLTTFGEVLTVYRDPIEDYFGFPKGVFVTQYESGLKIDFTLWPLGLIETIRKSPALPDELDIGYMVLLDKDQLTKNLQPPSHRAYIPKPPSQEEYLECIETFLSESTYVAKNLWRGDLLFAKYCLDHVMKIRHLLPMMEWMIEIEHDWSLKPGLLGKGLRKLIKPELWAELEKTFTGAITEANWDALFRTMDLFRKVAKQVGNHFNYAYPIEMDEKVRKYLQHVNRMSVNENKNPGFHQDS